MIQDDQANKWQCNQLCGACCHLNPADRQEALQALAPSEQDVYLSMVGNDGWCIHFESNRRYCRIYDERPSFCRVGRLIELFNMDRLDQTAFTLSCCRQQIRTVYGGRSKEMRQFEITSLSNKTHYD
ncbi:Fe-S cluster protein (chromatophore) [Paulinella micropora]|uniref:Fe-S cluster protein n=1 Tax=Paulinella micropora TaxID=1928728 RepID=A0A1L5YD11_9EUKA|nr:hypothetical protein PCKR_835 [Paulinella micropora]AQX45362.1 hypothetical protein PFK_835 [Paulinella micropora]BBL86582.1 Fe-S cluster protein [Paulinella micropora]